jgi:hypothetical protein
MARKQVGYYSGMTGKCNGIRLRKTETIIDTWCTYHAKYLLDCLECGRIFHSDRPHTHYCSTACSQRAYRNRKASGQ